MKRRSRKGKAQTRTRAPRALGGLGESAPDAVEAPPASFDPATESPRHVRAGLLLIERAIRGGWAIPQHVMRTLPAVVTAIAESTDSERERLRAVEVLLAMDRANQDALQAADRCERLDGGGVTDRVELLPISLRPGGAGNA
jgi:hypothetical protein